MKVLETRVPPPIVALLFAVLIWLTAKYAPVLHIQMSLRLITVSALAMVGMVCSLSGALTFRRARTTIDPMKPHQASTLVCTGIYRITRNPMYLGLVFVLSAWSLYLSSPEGLLAVIGFILYIQGFQILPEERALVKVFGEEYKTYQAQVRRWL